MAAAFSLKGSGDFDGQRAKWRVMVVGAADQSEAYDLASVEAPLVYLGVRRGSGAPTEQGGGVYLVEFDYTIRNEGTQPTGGQAHPADKSGQSVGTDLSFTFGGQKTRIFVSLETRFGAGRDGAPAPAFNRLIGYNSETHEIEGCEVYSRGCSYSITKQYADLTFGYLANLFANCATTNKNPFMGTDTDESLYIGADGSFKGGGGEKLPWHITGKFEYMPNQKDDIVIPDLSGILIPAGTKRGHDHIWFQMAKSVENAGGKDFLVARPEFAYVERVYEQSDFADLGMDS